MQDPIKSAETRIENAEAELAAARRDLKAAQTPAEPRPYYYGQQIKWGGAGPGPYLRYFAMTEYDDRKGPRICVMYAASTANGLCSCTDPKSRYTHLDGTPLGEFRMREQYTFETTHNWQFENITMLRWRDSL